LYLKKREKKRQQSICSKGAQQQTVGGAVLYNAASIWSEGRCYRDSLYNVEDCVTGVMNGV